MKQVYIAMLFVLTISKLYSQNFDEWFKQNKTQKKYLVKQIALLETYNAYLKNGFEIVQQGSQLITNFKKGELDLHSLSIMSLSLVNEKVINKDQLDKLQLKCVKAMKVADKAYSQCRNSGYFTKDELKVSEDVHTKIKKKLVEDILDLQSITTKDKLQMTDDERRRNFEKLANQINERLKVLKAFDDDNLLLISARMKERNNIKQISALHF